MTTSPVDVASFKRILARNVALPLGGGVLSGAIFLAIVFYILNVLAAVEQSDRVIGQATLVSRLTVDMETGLRGYLITGDDSFLRPYELALPRFRPELDTLEAMVADDPRQHELLRRIDAAETQWLRFASQEISARRSGGDFLTPVRTGRGKFQSDDIRDAFDTFVANENAMRQQRSGDARQATVTAVTLYVLFSLIVSGLLAFFGRRELTRLAGSYGDALREQSEHNAFLQRKTWLRAGQSQLNAATAGKGAPMAVARAALDFITNYVGGAVSALYVQEDGGLLRRYASHGLAHEEGADGQAFRKRETLVGQAAEENRLIQLDDVGEGYIRIASGLGAAPPRHLLIAPITHEGAVFGVLEIAFAHDIDERTVEFLKLVSGDLGITLAAAQYRDRLHGALAESQQLNEELQVQQEELRTANEELEERSRALEQMQANLENQQTELEQTNEQLTEQAAIVDQRNTALDEARMQLEERARDLERASQYKSEFLANMSHELRTPLNSSLILAKLLADNAQGNLDEEQVRFAQTIYASGNDLLNLINDILDISKVEAGKLELAPESVVLRRSVDALAQTFTPLAGQKQLRFVTSVEADVPATLFTDRQRLEQILRNLLSNAVKFTDSGEVSLTVAAQPAGYVSFTVRDTGIGIRPDQQEVIFEAFRQADGSTSRRYGGTGLGLSISRDLARLLGGSIIVQSEEGKGSAFTLSLPRDWSGVPEQPAPTPAPTRAAPTPPPAPVQEEAQETPAFPDDRAIPRGERRTVLVIEDDAEFAQILYDLAHEMGYRCIVALVAREGMQLAELERPDAILLDVRLPDRSGLSVLEQLKDNSRTRHIPVHIVSATDDAGAALHLGAIGYARKPTTREELEQVFRKVEEKITQKIKRILLVEDDAQQRESVVRLIADEDIEIRAVASGEEALALLRETIFDCMIIDLKLPDMQGKELLERMSVEDICSFPPVIVYTGRNLTREEEAGLLRYSRSIIIKGARSPERLLDEVTLFLHKVESQLSSERQSMLKTVRSRDRVFEGRTILLVDDDVRNVFALTSALEQKGVRVLAGRNGFEALDKLQADPEIDLVLMDIMMPGMDGLEATRRIRADQRFARLPIIAITAKAMKDDQEQCLAAGANDYLAKPIDLARLYSLLRVWMPNLDRL
ncbi:MAG: response regulator [Telluria sp.]